jgi:hypothetical protein
MKNLAGNNNCDTFIKKELKLAGVPVVHVYFEHPHEVPFTVIGKLGDFTFRRAWYYWVVNGPVPMSVAIELYNNPIGRKDIRVDGHCGCPAPDEWCHGSEFISLYHIDSQDGLNLFVESICKYYSFERTKYE